MVFPSALRIEREFALGYFTHQQFVALLKLIQPRGERPFRHQFEEKLQLILKRRRDNRVRTLRPLAVVLHAQGRILSRNKVKLASCPDANHPQVGRKIDALSDPCLVEFVVRTRHFFRSRKFKKKSAPKPPRRSTKLCDSTREPPDLTTEASLPHGLRRG